MNEIAWKRSKCIKIGYIWACVKKKVIITIVLWAIHIINEWNWYAKGQNTLKFD